MCGRRETGHDSAPRSGTAGRRPKAGMTTAGAEPWAVWNAFIDLIATEEFESLPPIQRVGHLIFWYESEVQNGGHYQFFVNGGTVHLHETVEVLGDLGLTCQAETLRAAGDVWLSSERTFPETGEDFASGALEGEFDELDAGFHECLPSLMEALESHLKEHQDEYVALV